MPPKKAAAGREKTRRTTTAIAAAVDGAAQGGAGGKKKKKDTKSAEDAEVAAKLAYIEARTAAPAVVGKGKKAKKGTAAADAAATATEKKKGGKKKGKKAADELARMKVEEEEEAKKKEEQERLDAIAAQKDEEEERLAKEKKKEKLKLKKKKRKAKRKENQRQEAMPASADIDEPAPLNDGDSPQEKPVYGKKKLQQQQQKITAEATTAATTTDDDDDSRKKKKKPSKKRPSAPLKVAVAAIEEEDDKEEEEEETPVPPPKKKPKTTTTVAAVKEKEKKAAVPFKENFFDDYAESTDRLGEGACGQVLTAVALADGAEYAVKVIDRRTQLRRRRIMREIDTLLVCKHHPNVVQLLAVYTDSVHCRLLFEKLHGGTLLDHLGRLSPAQIRAATAGVANALSFLHSKGIAHRDVKPENILCTDPDRVCPVKLCDLDLASKAVSPPTTIAELASPVGSADFMAPEVVMCDGGGTTLHRYDHRCDCWSLGVLLYMLVSGGRRPFEAVCVYGDCRFAAGSRSCGSDCGARDYLYDRIREGVVELPEQWNGDLKKLIAALLQVDPASRLSAAAVLEHPWIRNDDDAPIAPLLQMPPDILFRNDSARNLQQMEDEEEDEEEAADDDEDERMAVDARPSGSAIAAGHLGDNDDDQHANMQQQTKKKGGAKRHR